LVRRGTFGGKPSTTMIPLNDLRRQCDALGVELRAAMERVLASGWYVLGAEVTQFETEFAAYCGAAYCVGVANGTDALEIALRALGCGPTDEVVTVANAGAYATTAILAIGAHPVLADVDPHDMTISPDSLERCLGPKTRVVIATHLYGRLAKMDTISGVVKHRNIPIVEDCAQAHGALRGGHRAGTFGAISCFSFYPTKNLGALGDGGAVLTNDADLAKAARELRQYGWHGKYRAVRSGGRNSRLDEMQAAVLRVKLPRLDGWNSRRREIAERYLQALAVPRSSTLGLDHVAHLCVLRTKQRAAMQQHLLAAGIMTDVHYPIPDHRQTSFRGIFPTDLSLPETEAAAEQVLTVPCFPEMTEKEVIHIADSLSRFADENVSA
jgi:dTDP-3-amino-2,3,6-trideoxy-4-keto-D-glucose/dTDP-3-amino-3,4,6-trideoxy-alpha-D-glucose/dTDP-2,6-dideoxy-D-kanosamine transaminase